jgi:hypothetical protein
LVVPLLYALECSYLGHYLAYLIKMAWHRKSRLVLSLRNAQQELRCQSSEGFQLLSISRGL